VKGARFAWRLLLVAVLSSTAGCRRGDLGPGQLDRSGTPQVQHLRAFARLFGYLRYFHPSDEASAIDWDRLAIHGAGRVAQVQDATELRDVLDELFLPLAPTLRIYPTGEPPPNIELPAARADARPVAWQHVGFGMGTIHSAYRSARTNRRTEIPTFNRGFGGAIARLPAEAQRGKPIRLSALVKTRGREGERAQLWMRADRPDQKIGFFDNMDDRPITGGTWQRYQVQGKVDDDAILISFGGMVKGAGKAWIDDFRVEVEGPPGTWSPLPLDNAGFEAQVADARPWNTSSQGYRYQVVADGAPEGKHALLIESIQEIIDTPLFADGPALGELVTKPLGAGLSCRFPLVLPSTGGHTWGVPRRPLAPLQRTLASLDQTKLKADDLRVRLAGVIIAWNVFQHFYPYFEEVKVNWDVVLTRALERALADRTHAQAARTLNWLVAQLQDGHGSVADPARNGHGWLPWRLEWIEEQVVVTAARPDTGLRPGDVVQSIGGRPAPALMREAEGYLSGSPQWRRHRALDNLSEGPVGSELEVSVRRGSESLAVRARRASPPDLPPGEPPVRQLGGGIWYVNLDRLPWQQIAPRMKDIAAAPGVIFDLRGYPGDTYAIIQHLLTEDDRSDQWMQVARIARPDRERVVGQAKHAWGLSPLTPHIQGRVAFITGPQAISAAESFMSFIEHYRLAEIVGQPTAGTNGNIARFPLPGGFNVVFTGMKVVKHDGSQLFHVGIRPTVPVSRTIEGVRSGRDEPLEAALRVVRSGN
jgi:C-terminal processing protease CtpA/Prc